MRLQRSTNCACPALSASFSLPDPGWRSTTVARPAAAIASSARLSSVSAVASRTGPDGNMTSGSRFSLTCGEAGGAQPRQVLRLHEEGQMRRRIALEALGEPVGQVHAPGERTARAERRRGPGPCPRRRPRPRRPASSRGPRAGRGAAARPRVPRRRPWWPLASRRSILELRQGRFGVQRHLDGVAREDLRVLVHDRNSPPPPEAARYTLITGLEAPPRVSCERIMPV